MGFRTVAIARGKDKEALARQLGAWHYIDTQSQDAVAELIKLGGAKVIRILFKELYEALVDVVRDLLISLTEFSCIREMAASRDNFQLVGAKSQQPQRPHYRDMHFVTHDHVPGGTLVCSHPEAENSRNAL
jgi:D-arabinose 1-dehydrogenase-like Zn-dependent alcohol dehydrogenase